MTHPARISRRESLLAAAAAMAATAWAQNGALAANDETHPWIDAHSHIWSTDLKQYPLRNNQAVDVLQPRSFTDEELMAIAQPEGVGDRKSVV